MRRRWGRSDAVAPRCRRIRWTVRPAKPRSRCRLDRLLTKLVMSTNADERDPRRVAARRPVDPACRRPKRANRAIRKGRSPSASPPKAATLLHFCDGCQPLAAQSGGLNQNSPLASHKDREGHHGYDTANDPYHHRHLIGRTRTSTPILDHHEARHQPRFFTCRKHCHDHDHVARRLPPRIRASAHCGRGGRVNRPRVVQGGVGRPRGPGRADQAG